MTRDESVTIVAMVASAWSQAWALDEMESYARGILEADAEIVTLAVLRAQRELVFRPSVAEILDYARVERRLRNEADPHNIMPEKTPRPEWVLRWNRARAAGDMRPFPWQGNAIRDQGGKVPDTLIDDRDDWIQDDEYTSGDDADVTIIGRSL